MKVIVSVTNDLVTDQRVHKVCTSLARAGYEITLVGRKRRNSPPLRREYKTYRMRLLFNKSFFFYAEYNVRLFFYLLFKQADIFLSNDTDSLLANYLAAKIKRKALVFDAHEMFREVPEVIDRKRVQRFWIGIEDHIFPKLKHSYTVCQSIADEYKKLYGMEMGVVRNIPFAKKSTLDSPTPIDKKDQKVILYQGAVNIGRGIEWLIDAMPYLDDYIFYVIGDGDVLGELKEKVKAQSLEDRVIFLGRVPFEELSAYTACADIGVNLLENKGLNYYYSLPNRIFDLIRNNIPILATDFPEVRRIVERYDLGLLIDHYEPEYVAKKIKELSAKEPNKTGFEQANKELSWENEEQILLSIIEKASGQALRK